MRPMAPRAGRTITSFTLLLAVAGCGDGKAFVEGRNAEREGKVDVAYERYCRAAAEHPDSGTVASALRRVIRRAAAHWESRGRIAERQGRTSEAWQMYMRALAIHPNDPFLADVIRSLEKNNKTEIADARLTWMRGGYPALAVAVRPRETVVAKARPSTADIEPVGSATDATNGASEATAPDEAVAQVTEAPSVNETAVDAARPQADRPAQPELANAGHTDGANTSGGAATIRHASSPAIAKNTEAGPALSTTPRVSQDGPPRKENPPPPARTNLADALAWIETLRKSEQGLRSPERQEAPTEKTPVVDNAVAREPGPDARTPPVESAEPSGGRPTRAPVLASPGARQTPRPPDYDVRSKPGPDGSEAGPDDAGAVPAFLRVHTLSRRNHRYVKSIKTVDGVTIKLKDTDSEGDADFNLYYGHKRFKQVRDIRVGQAATFRGQSGRLFKMVILDIQHKSHTVRLGIKPA